MYKLSKFAAGSVIAAAAAIGSAGVALADGYAPKGKVVYERPSDWSGVYFGVSSGFQWSSVTSEFVAAPGVFDSADPSSSIVGAHLGLQHQFGNVVLGVEGNWISGLRTDEWDSVDCPNPARTCSKRFNDVLTIGGRLGWAAGHWMPYVTGGYANAKYVHHSEAKVANAAGSVSPLDGGARLPGWYVGGGFEWAISPGWTTGLEYRHYEFDSEVFQTNASGVPSGEFRNMDASMDSITARVSWRWGRPEPTPLK